MILSDYLIFIIGIFATFFTLWSTVPQIRKSLRTDRRRFDMAHYILNYRTLIMGSVWSYER